jgi:hypothetical protein
MKMKDTLCMSKNIFLMVVLALLFLISCKKEIREDVTYFQDTRKISGKILINSQILQDPFSMTVVDSFLVIGNLNGNPLIEVYNRFSGEFVTSFLERGQGPTETLGLGNINFFEMDQYVYLYDLIGRKLLRVNKDSFSSNNTATSIEPFINFKNINSELVSQIGKAQYYNDSILILSLQTSKGRLGVYNVKNGTTEFFYPIIDVIDPVLDDYQNSKLFSVDMTVSPNKRSIALSAHMADILDIFEYKENRLDSIWHYQSYLPNNIQVITFENTPPQAFYTSKSKTGYVDITSSNQNVYALFVGKNGVVDHPVSTD